MKNILIYTFLLIILSACTQPTGYVERGMYWWIEDESGVDEKQIGHDEFVINAEGNLYSSAEHVAKLALYHAAHVTLENEKEFFQIVQRSDSRLSNYQSISIPAYPGLLLPVAETSTRDKHKSILIIRITDEEQTSPSKSINASQVIDNLKPYFENKQEEIEITDGPRSAQQNWNLPQKDINAMADCHAQIPDVKGIFDPITGYFIHKGENAEKFRQCLKTKHGWFELGPPEYATGTMAPPR